MNKLYVFKSFREGNNKQNGNPYRILELHDPATLENSTYYLQQGQQLPTLQTLKFKDQIEVVHGVSTFNGKPQLTVEQINKKAF